MDWALKNHFSKFSIIWPQKNKCDYKTIECIESFYLHINESPSLYNWTVANNHVSDSLISVRGAIYFIFAYIYVTV